MWRLEASAHELLCLLDERDVTKSALASVDVLLAEFGSVADGVGDSGAGDDDEDDDDEDEDDEEDEVFDQLDD